MRQILPEDMKLFKMVHQARVRGNTVVFTVTQISGDEYESNLWLTDGERLMQLTRGGMDTNPAWSPDGRTVAFLRRGQGKDAPAKLMAINVSGGEAYQLSEGDIESIRWPGDGKYIYFLMRIGQGKKQEIRQVPDRSQETSQEAEDDVRIAEGDPLWLNGKGWVHDTRRAVFRVEAQGGKPERISDAIGDVTAFDVAPDGGLIYSLVTDLWRPYLAQLHVLKDGEDLALGPKLAVESVCWAPYPLDGKAVVVVGHDLRRGLASHNRLLLVDLEGKVKDLLPDLQVEVGNAANSDMRGSPPDSGAQVWGPELLFTVSEAGRVNLLSAKISGEVRKLTSSDWTVESFSADGEMVAFTAMTEQRPAELYVIRDGNAKRVTGFNDDLIAELPLKRALPLKVSASDGRQVDGWALMPEGPEKKVPVLLEVHGGPKTMYGYSLTFEHQLLSQRYAVVYFNPRGSAGYSEEFADIRGHYGERDYQDLMDGLKAFLSSFPQADPDRVCVAGGSYGGFMVNWMVTHSSGFRAAISERSISNWTYFFGSSDIGPYFSADQVAGSVEADLWSATSSYLEKSPLMKVKSVTTPLLIIHSLEDYRCHHGEAVELYSSLAYLGKKVKIALFPNENHDLSRTGKPSHRIRRLKLISSWLQDNTS
ncbi:MAG: prolyl oligopeptidase family serine peptidase [Thermoprotei archaeon]|nr:S9 family peptidase [TACK group archaeon]